MRKGIKIKTVRKPDDDGFFQYEIRLSNEDAFTTLVFWDYGDTFKEFGERLTNFPGDLKDFVSYELGTDENYGQPKWAYYLLLSVFCYDATGKSAIKVIVDNHLDVPHYSRTEFYILSEPASINRLGQLLKNWNPRNENEISWFSHEIE